MASVIQPISVAAVAEILAPVWIEVAMFSCAAVIYLASSITVTRGKGTCSALGSPRGSPNIKSLRSPSLKQCIPPLESAAAQSAAQTPAFGKVTLGDARRAAQTPGLGEFTLEKTSAILSKLSDAEARAHLAQVGPQLLLTVARISPQPEADALSALSGKVDASTLEVAVSECIKRRDFATCRRLHRIAGAVSAPKNQRTLVAFAKALNRDSALMRSLVDEAATPVSRPFAEAVIKGSIEMKDAVLAADIFERVSSIDVAALRTFAAEATAANEMKEAKAIQALSNSGDLAHAISKFEKLTRRGGNSPVYNSIIEACVAHNDIDKAMAFFAEAQNQGHVGVTLNAARKPEPAEIPSAEPADKGMSSEEPKHPRMSSAPQSPPWRRSKP